MLSRLASRKACIRSATALSRSSARPLLGKSSDADKVTLQPLRFDFLVGGNSLFAGLATSGVSAGMRLLGFKATLRRLGFTELERGHRLLITPPNMLGTISICEFALGRFRLSPLRRPGLDLLPHSPWGIRLACRWGSNSGRIFEALTQPTSPSSE